VFVNYILVIDILVAIRCFDGRCLQLESCTSTAYLITSLCICHLVQLSEFVTNFMKCYWSWRFYKRTVCCCVVTHCGTRHFYSASGDGVLRQVLDVWRHVFMSRSWRSLHTSSRLCSMAVYLSALAHCLFCAKNELNVKIFISFSHLSMLWVKLALLTYLLTYVECRRMFVTISEWDTVPVMNKLLASLLSWCLCLSSVSVSNIFTVSQFHLLFTKSCLVS